MEARKETDVRLLTAKDAGKLCRLSKRSWFRFNSCGRIPEPVRIGGSVRWRHSDIQKWLEWDCPSRKEFNSRMEAQHD